MVETIQLDVKTMKSRNFNNLQKFILGLGVYYFLDVLVFLISIFLYKYNQTYLNEHLYIFILVTFIGLVSFFIIYKYIIKNDIHTNKKIVNILGYSIILSKLTNVFVDYVSKNNFQLRNQLSVVFLIIPILISMFWTGIILKNKILKILSVLFIFTPLIINLIPNITIHSMHNLSMTFYMYPIFLNILFLSIFYFSFKNLRKS